VLLYVVYVCVLKLILYYIAYVLHYTGKRAIRCVGFSTCGKYVASVDNGNEQMVTVWDWKTGAKLASKGAEKMPKKV